jgi:hypothetical protein
MWLPIVMVILSVLYASSISPLYAVFGDVAEVVFIEAVGIR